MHGKFVYVDAAIITLDGSSQAQTKTLSRINSGDLRANLSHTLFQAKTRRRALNLNHKIKHNKTIKLQLKTAILSF